MYKHWEAQKRIILDVIGKKQCAVCQVSYGTNYSIFFRNIHSDLLLKKSILPVYVDLTHLSTPTLKGLFCLVLMSIKRTLVEKKLSGKLDFEDLDEKTSQERIKELIMSLASMNIVFFFEDTDIILPLGHDAFALFNDIRNEGLPVSFIYLAKTNFSHPQNYAKLKKAPHLYENIIYFPIRDRKSLRSIEKGMTPYIFDTIYNMTGGVDLFHGIAVDLKNNLSNRERKHLGKHLASNWHLKKEMHELWKSLSVSEVKALSRVVWKAKEIEEELIHDINHLVSIGILQKANGGYEFTIGLLKEIGIEKAKSAKVKIEFNREKLLVNGTNVPVKFTSIEKKILKQFLTNKNRIVGKEYIAKSMGNGVHSEKCNDQVVDLAVSKIKNKLSNAWINPENLVPVEGRGYIYRESV